MLSSARRPMGRIATVSILAGLFVAGAAGSALAIVGDGPTGTLSTTGASFTGGRIHWFPQGVNQGGMEVSGNLNDTLADNNSVYMKGSVAALGFSTLWNNKNGNGSSVRDDVIVIDEDLSIVSSGRIAVCRNGIIDNCTEQSERR